MPIAEPPAVIQGNAAFENQVVALPDAKLSEAVAAAIRRVFLQLEGPLRRGQRLRNCAATASAALSSSAGVTSARSKAPRGCRSCCREERR